ncbi:MAG: trypsin-like peptidase domain-containing protein [Candidatus Rokubacteria bacterium]|nr:trypsin-like peptidase domain-containing protein [Candidatus Rokubacteria bacterium]
MASHSRSVLLIALLVVGSLGAGFGIHAVLTGSPSGTRPSPLAAAPTTPEGLQVAFTQVAQQVRPAVVNVGTVHVARRRPPLTPSPFSEDPLFKDFFEQFFGSGEGPRGEFKQPSLGSGVIIDKRGYVLTNFHVVKGADEITVRLSSKKEYRGRVVGTDAKTDLAVIRFQPDSDRTEATLGNSDTLTVGEWAIAIGNPFGLDQTVTVGVISATGRSDVGIATYENFIQTDASINPGNSGGPLLNLKGEVMGINTAIVAAGQGIGFAIPINMVKRVVNQLVDRGKVIRGWLGVAVQPLTPELAQSLGAKGTQGAVVASIYPGSPAADAGLQPGDLILTFDRVPVEDYHHLQRLAADSEVGKRVTLGVLRKRQPLDLTARIAEMPGDDVRKPR